MTGGGSHDHDGPGTGRRPGRGSSGGAGAHARVYPVDLPVAPEEVGQPIDRVLRRHLRADPAHVQKLLRQARVAISTAEGTRTARRGEPLPEGALALRVEAAPPRSAPHSTSTWACLRTTSRC